MDGIWLASYIAAWLLVVAQGLVAVSLFWALGRIHLQNASEASVLMTDEGPQLHEKMQQFETRDHVGNLLSLVLRATQGARGCCSCSALGASRVKTCCSRFRPSADGLQPPPIF